MATRRDFVSSTVAALLGAGGARASQPTSARLTSPVSHIDTAIVDSCFHECRHFAETMYRGGVPIRSFKRDVTQLWFTELHPSWQSSQSTVAGLTSYGTLFCLERLAWDHGMRIVYRAKHARSPRGTIHEFSGNADSLVARICTAPFNPWPHHVARWLLQDWPVSGAAGNPPPTNLRCQSRTDRFTPTGSVQLYSWVIALPQPTRFCAAI
jgi:hypothetical protein